MRRTAPHLLALVAAVLVLAGADGCSSDPNVEGARLYVNQQNYTAALERLDAALATNPDNADALALKAEVLRMQAEGTRDAAARRPMVEQMVATLERAESVEPGNAEVAQTRLVAWAHEMNTGGTTLRAAGQDAAQLATAVSAFENAVLLQPDSAGGHYNLGLALLVSGNSEAAVAPLQRVVDMGASDADAYVYLSRALLANQRGAEAVTLLERAQTTYPDDAAIRAELLNAYAATNQPDRALGAYEGAVAATPDDPLIRYNYGSMLLQAGRLDEAVTQLRRAVELDAANANAQYNLGAAYQNQAAAFNERINAADGAEQQRLQGERNALLQQSLAPFVEARRLTAAEGASVTEVCDALFRVYTALERLDEAREAGACAGQDMN